MKLKLMIILSILSLVVLAGCQQTIIKYHCSTGDIVDSIDLCPVFDCSTCELPPPVEVVKFKCLDGTVKDILADCDKEEEYVSADKNVINEQQVGNAVEFDLKYGSYNEEGYLLEFTLTNQGSADYFFEPKKMQIALANGSVYEAKITSAYPINSGDFLKPGVVYDGYWIFPNVPKGVGTGTFSFEIGYINKAYFNFSVPLY